MRGHDNRPCKLYIILRIKPVQTGFFIIITYFNKQKGVLDFATIKNIAFSLSIIF